MSIDLAYFNITLSNNISNIVIPHINMLCSFMKHLIFCKTDSTMAITKYSSARCNPAKSLVYKPLNQIASLYASEIAIYSASVVDKATVACKLAFQLTAQPSMVKT